MTTISLERSKRKPQFTAEYLLFNDLGYEIPQEEIDAIIQELLGTYENNAFLSLIELYDSILVVERYDSLLTSVGSLSLE